MSKKDFVKDWSGLKVLIIGAARQGLALARYLSMHGAKVILNDRQRDDELKSARDTLKDLQIDWSLGGHPISLLEGVDLVCPSGGVPLSIPLIREARSRGIPLSNDSQVFIEACPCPVVGITGSAGKTTTATLLSLMVKSEVERTTIGQQLQKFDSSKKFFQLISTSQIWLGGNIGQPLISSLDDMQSDDLAIIELSSFQLELMTVSPEVAAVLNIKPDHLDRHGAMDNYLSMKARILEFQNRDDWAVLGRDDQGSWSLIDRVRGSLLSFGLGELTADQSGTFLKRKDIILQGIDNKETRLMSRQDIGLRGDHNLANVLAACTIAYAVGVSSEAMRRGVLGFEGIPHRLEFVRSWGGARWFNDSIATTPDRAIAGINSFDEPLILLAGGKDKELSWDEFAEVTEQKVNYLILFGESSEKISSVLYEQKKNYRPEQKSKCQIICRKNLHQAVKTAAQVVFPGSVVLLSPGATSYDEFHDFEDRGEAFKRWVMQLQ
ncbi:MAG: UDP-N-acetylmuramoyl-L-alanine--D-glutamate ligase [Anaerolineales bacterium]|nr:UDP-N-acetylmuramoyl-L-alanine--D-glutamate ligase [Anaerolineales bacterium]